MKTKKLHEFVNLPKYEFNINLRNEVQITLANDSCHYLFPTKKSKSSFFKSISHQGTLFINCGLADLRNISSQKAVDQMETFQDLISCLENLLTNASDSFELKTLVIDNISLFYWDLKVLNQRNHQDLGYKNSSPSYYYLYFSDLIESLKNKYSCNIIVTSWDINFDKGYNYSWRPISSVDSLQSLTYLPSLYLLKLDYIIHSDEKCDRYFNKAQEKWIELGKMEI